MENLIGQAIQKKVTKELDGVNKKNGKAPERKGRPALDKASDDRDKVRNQTLQFKSIVDWNRKLEHMHTILTADDSNCKQSDPHHLVFSR